MGNNISSVSNSEDFGQFYDMVQTGHPLDLKNRNFKNTDYSIWSRGWNGNPLKKGNLSQPSPDYLGNYLYGYYGSSVNINSEVLKLGAGAAQEWSNITHGRNYNWTWYGDNLGDTNMIQDGLDDYKKYLKNKEK